MAPPNRPIVSATHVRVPANKKRRQRDQQQEGDRWSSQLNMQTKLWIFSTSTESLVERRTISFSLLCFDFLERRSMHACMDRSLLLTLTTLTGTKSKSKSSKTIHARSYSRSPSNSWSSRIKLYDYVPRCIDNIDLHSVKIKIKTY
jgi:hypothetical protein